MRKDITKKLMIIIGIMLLILLIKTTEVKGATIATFEAGENVTAVLDNQGTLTMTGTGPMYDWNCGMYLTTPWTLIKSEIKRVVISDGITTVGSYAFYYCDNLQEVIIPNSITSINNSSFLGCYKLKKFEIINNKTKINENAFNSSVINYFVEKTANGKYSIELPKIIQMTIKNGYQLNNCEISEDGKIISFIKSSEENKDIALTINPGPGGGTGFTLRMIVLETWDISENSDKSVLGTLDKDGKLKITGSGRMKEFTEYNLPWKEYNSFISSIEISEGIANISSGIIEENFLINKLIIPSTVAEISNYAFRNGTIYDVELNSKNSNYCYVNGAILTKDKTKLVKYVNNNSKEKEYTIPTGVKVICPYAFSGNTNFESIIIPDSVTTLMSYAFYNAKIKKIILPDSITEMGRAVFIYCEDLEEVKLSKNVSEIPTSAFWLCRKLEKIDIPEGVTTIECNAFAFCYKLYEICLPSTIIHMDVNAFRNGETAINIDTNNKKYCSIDGVVFNKEKTSLIMYPKNKKGEVYEIPEGVTTIEENAFRSNEYLQEIIIPNSVTKIESYAFDGCKSLRKINIPNSVIETGDNIVTNNKLPIFFDFNDKVNEYYNIEFPELLKRTMNEKDPLYTKEEFTFKNCEIDKDLNIIKISKDKINEDIEITVNGGMLTGLNYVVVPTMKFDISKNGDNTVVAQINNDGELEISGNGSIKDFSTIKKYKEYIKKISVKEGITILPNNAFEGYNKVTEVELSNSLKEIGNEAFRGCSRLTNISIPNSVVNIGEDAFAFCYSLKEIIIPKRVTNIECGTFEECSSLKKIEIPQEVTNIGDYAFEGCNSLTEMIIPSSVKNIGIRAFNGCNNLEKVIIPEGVISIGDLAFCSCNNLKEITIPSSAENMGIRVFNGCDNLEKVKILNGLSIIKDSTFSGCCDLKEVIIPTSVKKIVNIPFYNSNKAIINTEKGSAADKYAQENNINRLTYTTMEKTNSKVDLELNGELIYSFINNGEYKVNFTYKNENEIIPESIIVKVDWIYPLLGDTNADGKRDITDLLVIKRHIVAGNKQQWKLEKEKEERTDINKDGKVDVTDLLLLKRHIVSGNKEEWKIK